jgi:NTE family protein
VSRAQTPAVLVLGGGGTLGEAWMLAVLAGIDEADGFDARRCRRYLGTSAGSIVAASLVAGIAPAQRLGELVAPPIAPAHGPHDAPGARRSSFGFDAAAALGASVGAPLASLAFASTSAGGALLRRAALRALPAGHRSLAELRRAVERAGVQWDGRLWVAAVDRDNGRRVVFGAPRAPHVSVALAVAASCAVPGLYAPVRAAGRTYVDGGVWSPTNLDALDAQRGERVLCLNPTGSLRTPGASAIARISRTVAAAEALALKHRGAHVATVNPDRASSAAIGANLMDARRRARVVHAGLAQGRSIAASSLRNAA